MDGRRRLRASAMAVCVACAGLVGGAGPAWAQAPEEGESGEVLSEEQLEQLLDTPAEQPSGAELSVASFGPEQLASYFAEGVLARAHSEVRRGRFVKARALLADQEPTLPVRFLRAQSALLGRDYATAAEELAALAVDYVPLKDHCLLWAAQANEKLRRLELAAAQYREVSSGSPLYAEARFSLSRVLQRQRDIPGALQALQELIDSRQARGPDALRMKALLAICDLARAQGLYNVEHRALLEVWATSPLSREAQRAKERLKGLPLPLKWKVRRGEALVELHRHGPATELLAGVMSQVDPPDELSCRAHLAFGRALRKERQHRRAIQMLTPVVEKCTSAEYRPQALYVLGYSQSVVDPRSAITTYATLARDYPEHGYADDALFFEAWLLQRTGQLGEALARYQETAERYPGGNFASEALFRAFWLHTRREAKAEALSALEAVERLPAASRTDEALWRARYWRARVREPVPLTSATALDDYEQLATERPATWYGMLARSRLAMLAPERLGRLSPVPGTSAEAEEPADEVWPLPPGPLRHDVRFAAGVELLRLGHPGAADELLAVNSRGLSEAPARLLYQTMVRTGRKRAARQVARESLRREVQGPLSPESRPVWEATWPLAFRNVIQRYSKASKVDPDLMQGLIREESRFRPTARSSTGALGLAQLMPATAKQVAQALKLGDVGESNLLQPAQNVRLGSAYLGQLLHRFGGNVAYAVAAYNAGPHAVDRWRQALPQAELDEWVEHIAFDETREYVKHVLGSYGAYKLLYTGQPVMLHPTKVGDVGRR
ncbi:transglycosylase SLT domain-containing protein [Myxococcus fulvus]|uniref:lytic transglycosylase domain-containing protein n=1 Tax=Myxococcus fulvus TaxID=33 RepID=UPI003B9BD360